MVIAIKEIPDQDIWDKQHPKLGSGVPKKGWGSRSGFLLPVCVGLAGSSEGRSLWLSPGAREALPAS